MKILLKVVLIALIIGFASCTIDGLTFMHALVQRKLSTYAPGEDPCHPLYWYPRDIPEYCQYKTTPKDPCVNDTTPTPLLPMPVPIPVPFPPMPALPPPPPPPPPPPMPMPYPLFPLLPPPPPIPLTFPVPPSYMPGPPPPPPPMLPPLPYGVPLAPTNPMIPVPGMPYPYMPPSPNLGGMRPQVGMVPGVPGLVSSGGGINVLPFSDAYSDMLESHRQRVLNKQMAKLVAKYDRDHHSRFRGYRKYRKHSRRRRH